MLSQSRRNALIVIWTVIFMIATLLVAGYAFGLNEANSYQEALNASKYVLEVRNTRRVVADMETSSLNYIISGSDDWRTRYNGLSAQLPAQWQALETSTAYMDTGSADGEDVPALAADMRRKADAWQSRAVEPEMALRANGNRDAALTAIANGTRKNLYEDFIAAADKVENFATTRLVESAGRAADISNVRQGLLLGLGTLALLMAIYSIMVVRRDMRLQEQATRAAEAEAQRLQTIFDSIPIGVRLLDSASGNAIAQNKVAERIFPAQIWNSLQPRERMSYFHISRPDGTPISYEEMPASGAVVNAGGVSDFEMRTYTSEAPGKFTDLLVGTAPLRDARGRIISVVVVLQDVTHMKELDQRKDEFIATAAHELRSPLTILTGYNQLMLKLLDGVENLPPGLDKYQRAMARQMSRLNDLVEHLLDASRIQLGRLMLERRHFNIVDLARAAAANAQTVDEMQHTVHVVSSDDDISGDWDLTRIEQVLTNLMSNAMRYSPEDEDVEVKIARTGGSVRVEVVDRGPGVPEENRAALFERYYQGSDSVSPISEKLASATPRRGALGLGLYLSSEIIKAHNGKIGMSPNPEGGSIFWFTLPLSSVPTLEPANV